MVPEAPGAAQQTNFGAFRSMEATEIKRNQYMGVSKNTGKTPKMDG